MQAIQQPPSGQQVQHYAVPVPRSERQMAAGCAQQSEDLTSGQPRAASPPRHARPRVLAMPGNGHHQNVLESPILLPMLPTEPSPTTGMPYPLPLFRGTPRAMTCRTTSSTGEASTRDASGTPEGRKRQSQANVDGYQWKKYGEKNLKCSDTPRSYYKCSVAGCSAKKYVEYDPVSGEIAQTVIKGDHTHGKVMLGSYIFDDSPRLAKHHRKGNLGDVSPESCNGLLSIMHAAKLAQDSLSDTKEARSDTTHDGGRQQQHYQQQQQYQQQRQFGEGDLVGGGAGLRAQPSSNETGAGPSSSGDTQPAEPQTFSFKRPRRAAQGAAAAAAAAAAAESGGTDGSADAGTDTATADDGGSAGSGGDRLEGSGDRKVTFVETEAENVDDGFKWRKYGRKQVKNSAYPRNYYRCTTEGCPVKKHVERYSQDPRQLMVCYEYLPHSHEQPAEVAPVNRGAAARRAAAAAAAAAAAHPDRGVISTRRQAAAESSQVSRNRAAAQLDALGPPPPQAPQRGMSGGGANGSMSLARSLNLQQQHFATRQQQAAAAQQQARELDMDMDLLGAGRGAAVAASGSIEPGVMPPPPRQHQPGLLPMPMPQLPPQEMGGGGGGMMPPPQGMQGGMLSPHRIDLLASVVAQQEHLDSYNQLM